MSDKNISVTFTDMGEPSFEDIRGWLEEKARIYNLRWLLVHADDGVIWGEMRHKKLELSNGDRSVAKASEFSIASNVSLRYGTIQTAHLFSDEGELLLWRNEYSKLSARLAEDVGEEYEDERYLLWGTSFEGPQKGFTKCTQWKEGICHVVPFEIYKEDYKSNDWQAPKIKIRHYLAYDDDGCVYFECSRLVSLEFNGKGVNK